jgi:preprotein translocase subunit SecF
MRILQNPNFNFIKWRWHAIVLSIAVIGAGAITILQRGGLPLGVDFSGGSVVILHFDQPVAEDAVRGALRGVTSEAVVQRYGTVPNQVMIRTPLDATQDSNLDSNVKKIEDSMRAANIGSFTRVKADLVGSVVGEDLKRKGIWATLTALGGILLYIGFRFRFSFAAGAVVATFHDIAVTLAFLTWFGYDVSLNIIAAILTIAGYSVNDTIVIFDRVRENQRVRRRESLDSIVNEAVNQTLSRTIITAGVTFLAVMALYFFGGEVLRGFAFTMLVGIITGTYSTVFIASAVAILLSKKSGPTQVGGKAGGKTTKAGDARKARAS